MEKFHREIMKIGPPFSHRQYSPFTPEGAIVLVVITGIIGNDFTG
jgi:hypothetical protein